MHFIEETSFARQGHAPSQFLTLKIVFSVQGNTSKIHFLFGSSDPLSIVQFLPRDLKNWSKEGFAVNFILKIV